MILYNFLLPRFGARVATFGTAALYAGLMVVAVVYGSSPGAYFRYGGV